VNELALFAGGAGGILGGRLLGWRTRAAVELDAYARRVLLARQADGCLEPFPIWDDVQTFDGRPWRGAIDIVTGGFPCQDISAAGKGAGITGKRSGLWSHMARIIGEVRPRFVLVENSPVLTSRGLGVVLGDLAALGYDARWGVLGAVDAGAPHKRERIWILAHDPEHGRGQGRARRSDSGDQGERELAFSAVADSAKPGSFSGPLSGLHCQEAEGGPRDEQSQRCGGASGDVLAHSARIREREQADQADSLADSGDAWAEPMRGGESFPDSDGARLAQRQSERSDTREELTASIRTNWWKLEPSICGVADELADQLDIHGTAATGYLGRVAQGVPDRVSRLRCLGNGQVPAQLVLAWLTLANICDATPRSLSKFSTL